MPYKTIKEICALTGSTENALRYYDEKGILSPTQKRSSGRREWLYDEASIWKLELIILFRKIDLSVDEIRTVVDEMEKRDSGTLEKKLAELKKERDLLDRKITVTEVLVLIEEISADSTPEEKQKLLEQLIRNCDLNEK